MLGAHFDPGPFESHHGVSGDEVAAQYPPTLESARWLPGSETPWRRQGGEIMNI